MEPTRPTLYQCHVLPPQFGREVVRCAGCGLVQFVGELKHCRRCPVNFTEPAADDAMAADLALAAPGVDASRAIRFCRRACGLSQNEVARRMGVTRTHISKLENGQMPTAFTAMKLARAIGIPMWFFCALCEIGGRLG